MKKKKFICYIIICLTISFIIEIFIFNFRHFQSLDFKKEKLNIETGSDIKKRGYLYEINGNKNNYIEIKNINKEIKNLKINITSSDSAFIIYEMKISDDGNQEYYNLPERFIYPSIEKSKYVTLHTAGKLHSVKIYLRNYEGTNAKFNLNSIVANTTIPIDISYTRVIITFMICFFIILFRKRKQINKVKVNFKDKKQILIMTCIMLFFSIFFLYIENINTKLKTYGLQHNQLQVLAETLRSGKVNLNIPASKELKKMKNPYDNSERIKKSIDYQWDTAYYKGKYYVYFGVVPVILTYLPYLIIFNKALPNYIAIYIALVFIIIGLFFLEKEVVNKYFKNIPFSIFAFIYIWFLGTLGFIGIACYPTLYNIPIAYALMFTFWGLYFWLSSIKENGDISTLRITIGSLCMALVAGCRPQLLLCSFYALLIFKKSIKNKKLFSKDSKLTTICALLPYFVVAVLLMYYNYIRFGSPFDFGANYNLTGNDMTKRGFNFDRIGLGIFCYLLIPPSIEPTFPFLNGIHITTNYMGITIRELLFGGALVINPLLFLGIFGEKPKNKDLKLFCILNEIFALIIIILDTEMAGILQRYFSDFDFLLGFSSVIVIFSYFNSNKLNSSNKYIFDIILFFVILGLIHQFLYIFDDQLYHEMINNNPAFYFKWYYLLQWWL